MPQRHGPCICDLRRHRRLEHFTGIKARNFLALPYIVKCADVGEWFESSAETALGFLGRPRNSAHFAFDAREKRHQQVGLPQRIAAQHDRFRLSQRHGSVNDEGFILVASAGRRVISMPSISESKKSAATKNLLMVSFVNLMLLAASDVLRPPLYLGDCETCFCFPLAAVCVRRPR